MNYSSIHLPKISPVNKLLIITFVAIFLVDSILGKFTGMQLVGALGLSGSSFFGGHIYQLITYPFIGRGPIEVLFDGLILWFIGSEIEHMWGRKRYLGFLAATILGGGVIYLLINLFFFSSSSILYAVPLVGLGGVCGALCMAFGILFPDRMMYFFFFPIKARYFAPLLIAMVLYQGLFSPGGILAWGQLGAFASAFVWMLFISNPRLKGLLKRKKSGSKKKSGHLRVIKGDKDDDITYH